MQFHKMFTAIFCLFVCTLHAQWQQTVLPLDDFEDLYGISFLSDSEFFICSNTQISKTNNGGQSWQVKTVNQGFPFNLFLANTLKDIHFYSPTEGLATGVFNIANDELVIRTSDGADTWAVPYTNSPFTPPVYFNALDVNGATGLACGLNGHIIRSTDFGNSFNSVNLTPDLTLFDIKFLSASRAIAIGEGAVLRSFDAGATWTADPAFAGSGASSIALAGDGVVYMTGADGLFTSIDNGLTFSSQPIPFMGAVHTLAASHDTLFAGYDQGVYVSTDGGSYWQQFKNIQNVAVLNVEIRNSKAYALCRNSTLLVLDMTVMQPDPVAYFSSDVDLQCGASVLSAMTTIDTSLVQIQWFLNNDQVSTEPGFSHTYDSLPWYAQVLRLVVTDKYTLATDTMTESIGVGFRDRVVAEAGPDIYQCYGSKMYLDVGGAAQFYEWFPHAAFDVQNNNYYAHSILTQHLYEDTEIILKAWNDSDCYDYDTLRVYVGEPKMEHFNFSQTAVPDNCSNASCVYISDLEFVSDSIGFGITNTGYLIKSTDAGNSWVHTQLPGNNAAFIASGLDFIDAYIGYTGNPFLKTIDGGQSFSQMPIHGYDCSFIHKDTGIVAGLEAFTDIPYVSMTLDGGQTFTKVFDAGTQGSIISGIKMVDADLLFIGGKIGGTAQLLRSGDGGQNWENIPLPDDNTTPDQFAALSADTLFFLYGQRVYRTYNSGQDWFLYFLMEDLISVWPGTIKMLNSEIGYITAGRRLFKTTNGGDCWNNVFEPDWITEGEYENVKTFGISVPPSGRSVYFGASNYWGNEKPVVFYQRFYNELAGIVDTISCVGTPLYTQNRSFGFTDYQWYVGDSLHSTSYNTDFLFGTPGDYTIKMVVDSAGAYLDSLVFSIHIKPSPGSVGVISGPVSLCAMQGTSGSFFLPDSIGFTQFIWTNETAGSVNFAFNGIINTGDNHYKVNLYPGNGDLTIYAYGVDAIGCISTDTASLLVHIQNALPPDPTMFSIDPSCLAVDANSFIDGQPMDSIFCAWEYADNTDFYTITSPGGQFYNTNMGFILNYFPCVGNYNLSLFNENACGVSENAIQAAYETRYANLAVMHTPDTTVALLSPVQLWIDATIDSVLMDLSCQVSIEWYFKGTLHTEGDELYLGAVTEADTGVYEARIYNGCDTRYIPVRLSIYDNVKTKDLTLPGALLLFPNPNSGTFTIELSQPAVTDMRFRITDLMGRLVQETKAVPGNSQQTVTTRPDLASGLYCLQVLQAGRVVAVKKFVKQ